jgi:hypothetical protein
MIYRPRVGQKVVWRVYSHGKVHMTRAVIELTQHHGSHLRIRLEEGSRVYVPARECYTEIAALRLALQEAAGQEPTP